MSTIDNIVEGTKGAVKATEDYVGREIKYGLKDKSLEIGTAIIGGGVGYYLGGIVGGILGLSVAYTSMRLITFVPNIYHSITSFFKFGKEVTGGGKKKTESLKPPGGSLQPAPATS